MPNMNQVKLDWSGIPLPVLNDAAGDIGKAWAKLAEAREKAAALIAKPQEAFEAIVAKSLQAAGKVPAGKEVRFAYNFGKAATALADVSQAKAKGGGLW